MPFIARAPSLLLSMPSTFNRLLMMGESPMFVCWPLGGSTITLSFMSSAASWSGCCGASGPSSNVSKFAYASSRLPLLCCWFAFGLGLGLVLMNARATRSATLEAASKPIYKWTTSMSIQTHAFDCHHLPNIFPAKLMPVLMSSARLRCFITDPFAGEICSCSTDTITKMKNTRFLAISIKEILARTKTRLHNVYFRTNTELTDECRMKFSNLVKWFSAMHRWLGIVVELCMVHFDNKRKRKCDYCCSRWKRWKVTLIISSLSRTQLHRHCHSPVLFNCKFAQL